MNNLILFLKGLIIGMGQIIPGVSGGMLSISLGLYDRCIEIISNIGKNFKSNIKFLFPIFLGIVTSILLISKIIKLSLLYFYVPTMSLFIGLILGALKDTVNDIKMNFNKRYIFISIVVTLLLTLLSLIKNESSVSINENFFMLVFVGLTYAFATVVPGVSSTALMMMLGYYSLIIDIISNLTNISETLKNINVIIPLGIGLIGGIFIISKLMNYLFKNKKILTNYIILGLITSSIITMFINTYTYFVNFYDIVLSIVLIIIGYNLISILNRKLK